MNRRQIIHQIKSQCIDKYNQIEDWVHGMDHVRRVVRNGKLLAVKEKLTSQNAFLVEIACWLHDIGRVGEATGLEFTKSNHAEVSYQMSKPILQSFQKQLGREGMYKVLWAVREHNLPGLIHKENIVGRVLVDADRGAGINPVGIFSMLSYLHITHIEPVRTQKQAIQLLPSLADQLEREGRMQQALEKINYLNDWYYGTDQQTNTGVKVDPLYTKSAVKLYKKGFSTILIFEQELIRRIQSQQQSANYIYAQE